WSATGCRSGGGFSPWLPQILWVSLALPLGELSTATPTERAVGAAICRPWLSRIVGYAPLCVPWLPQRRVNMPQYQCRIQK
ncbi:MAG: hypothetical protein FWH14_08965, partial [Oscillospiraceae bacterium]|nr:hypothetical protein [Oscillospiraceae bacterium]